MKAVMKTFRQVRIVHRDTIRPSSDNDSVYRPPQVDDTNIETLAESMKEVGVLEPIHVTSDGVIISGHRRYCASGVAGIVDLPVIVEGTASDSPEFLKLLVSHNQQRVKTIAEQMAETVVQVSGEDAHRDLILHRASRSRKSLPATRMSLGPKKVRSEISPEKAEFLAAAIAAVTALEDFWPVSVRTIHYQLLNQQLFRNTKRKIPYVNDRGSYSDLSGLLTKARFEGLVSFDAIHDPTRPVTTWNVHRNAGDYVRAEVHGFLRGYWRDLLQSQPNHIEVVGEKSTLTPIIEPVCMEYTVPLTIGRGYCSVPPRKQIHDRFEKSGKDHLVLIVMSDHDPDGEQIATSFAQSMRDDFGIPGACISAVRAALKRDQVLEMKLPPSEVEAKEGSSGFASYVKRFGTKVYELEAVPPRDLQRLLREAIDSALDLQLYRQEQAREQTDAKQLDVQRQKALAVMKL